MKPIYLIFSLAFALLQVPDPQFATFPFSLLQTSPGNSQNISTSSTNGNDVQDAVVTEREGEENGGVSEDTNSLSVDGIDTASCKEEKKGGETSEDVKGDMGDNEEGLANKKLQSMDDQLGGKMRVEDDRMKREESRKQLYERGKDIEDKKSGVVIQKEPEQIKPPLSEYLSKFTKYQSLDDMTESDDPLMIKRVDVFSRASKIPYVHPESLTYGFNSSILGLHKNLSTMLAHEEQELASITSGLAVFNVKVSKETKKLLMEVGDSVDDDKRLMEEVAKEIRDLGLEKCSKDFISKIGSFMVGFQNKNDVSFAKSLLLDKILRKKSLRKNISRKETAEIERLKAALATHKSNMKQRMDIMTEVASFLFTCYRRSHVPKEIVCTPSKRYLYNPRRCTLDDLALFLDGLIYYTAMRIVEHSYLQSCPDRISTCNKTCLNEGTSCFDCFTSSLCEKVHLTRKHNYGKLLTSVANQAYECETYHFIRMIKQ